MAVPPNGARRLASQGVRGLVLDDPEDGSIRVEDGYQAAQAAELLSMPEEAVGWYRKIDGGDRLLVAAIRRAYLTADKGDVEGARALLGELRNYEGQDYRAESYIAESEILVNAGRTEDALELLNEAVRPHQPDTRLLYSKAMLGVQLDNPGRPYRALGGGREPDSSGF